MADGDGEDVSLAGRYTGARALTTPRSLRCCAAMGIVPHELLERRQSGFRRQGCTPLTAQMLAEIAEGSRQAKLNFVSQEYKRHFMAVHSATNATQQSSPRILARAHIQNQTPRNVHTSATDSPRGVPAAAAMPSPTAAGGEGRERLPHLGESREQKLTRMRLEAEAEVVMAFLREVGSRQRVDKKREKLSAKIAAIQQARERSMRGWANQSLNASTRHLERVGNTAKKIELLDDAHRQKLLERSEKRQAQGERRRHALEEERREMREAAELHWEHVHKVHEKGEELREQRLEELQHRLDDQQRRAEELRRRQMAERRREVKRALFKEELAHDKRTRAERMAEFNRQELLKRHHEEDARDEQRNANRKEDNALRAQVGLETQQSLQELHHWLKQAEQLDASAVDLQPPPWLHAALERHWQREAEAEAHLQRSNHERTLPLMAAPTGVNNSAARRRGHAGNANTVTPTTTATATGTATATTPRLPLNTTQAPTTHLPRAGILASPRTRRAKIATAQNNDTQATPRGTNDGWTCRGLGEAVLNERRYYAQWMYERND